MTKNPIPAWATTPGATLLLEPGSYARGRQFFPVVVSRVTKASVFVKMPTGRERRFVPSQWGNDGDRMMEYGNSGSFHPGAYLWNPDAERIQDALAKARARKFETDIAVAAKELAGAIDRADRPGGDYEERLATLFGAIGRYRGFQSLPQE